MEPSKQGFTGGTYEYTLPNQPIFESSHTNSAFTLGNQCTYPQRIQPPPYQGYPAGPVVPAPSVQQTNTTIIMAQPNVSAPVQVDNTPPPNHRTLSVLSCLLCFWPIGLFAVVRSLQVDAAVRDGDIDAANDASRDAKRFSRYSIGVGAAIILFSTILRGILAA